MPAIIPIAAAVAGGAATAYVASEMQPDAPPPPTPIDPGKSSLDYINSMADPALQATLLGTESEFRPQYTDLNLADMRQYLLGSQKFDGAAYFAKNPDVAAAYQDNSFGQTPDEFAEAHYQKWGKGEGRQATYSGGQPGAQELFNNASLDAANTQAKANTIQRTADIADVDRLGLSATEAFQKANPALQAQMEKAQGLSSSGDTYASLRSMLGQGIPQFGNINFNPATANMATANLLGDPSMANANLANANLLGSAPQVGSGQLGDSLYQQALRANGLGQVGQTLQGRAQTLAQSTGALNPDELRQLQQSIREGYTARGTEMGSGAVSAEALGRLANERQRMQEDLALSSGLNQAGQAELSSNRGFATNVQAANIGRQQANAALTAGYDMANQSATNQFGLANQSALNQFGLANQSAKNQFALTNQSEQNRFGLANQSATNQFALYNNQTDLATQENNRNFSNQQYQQQVQNLGLLGQADQSRLGQDRTYALQLAQMQASIASDPFQAILGRSESLNYGAGAVSNADNLTQNLQGPQLFDPNAGINLALANNKNTGNYNSAVYGINANQSGQLWGSLLGAAGSLGGAYLKGKG